MNHTIIPTHDRFTSAKWYAEIFGFEYSKNWGPFSIVKVNDTLTLDLVNEEKDFADHHYAFKVSEREFDEIMQRLQKKQVQLASGPTAALSGIFDGKTYSLKGGRGVYFLDPNRHLLEIMTADYDL